MNKSTNNKLTSTELSYFCMQIAMVLKSGMLISEGVDWMYDDIEDGKVKDALYALKNQLAEKVPLYKAMDNSGYFPSYVINMSNVGSVTGKLEEVMISLSDYYDRDNFLKSKIRNSIFYPSMLFIIMSFIIILLVTKIFPIFEGMLKELGGVSNQSFIVSFEKGIMAGRIAMVFVIAILIMMALFFIIYRSKDGKARINKFLSHFPPTKSIMKKITAYKFSASMSLLLSSGMNIDSSMDLLLDIVDDPVLKEKVMDCKASMDAGNSFLDSLPKLSVFSGMHLQMLNMGQRTGEMDIVMNKLTNIYENEADQSISNVVALIEPVLVGVLSLLVGVILISVMLPLMNIMSSIG